MQQLDPALDRKLLQHIPVQAAWHGNLIPE